MRAFECKRCGRCCEGLGGIVLSSADLSRIASHLGLAPAAFAERHAERSGDKLVIRVGEDGFCVFFKDGAGCSVYLARPDVCRAWPFFRGNLLDAVSLGMAAGDCPGINTRAGFAAFRRQGLEYLRANALAADPDDATAANALKIEPDCVRSH